MGQEEKHLIDIVCKYLNKFYDTATVTNIVCLMSFDELKDYANKHNLTK